MSDNIIDLAAERNKQSQPDPEFIRHDEYGRPLYSYGVEYQLGERTFTFNIWAYSWVEAEANVVAIRDSAKVYGQIFSEIPA